MKCNCEECMNYCYDEEYEAMVCIIEVDEDEYCSFLSDKRKVCPYYRRGDDYTLVRKQN